ncbi:MAG: prolyl oligopeptidase family serine peptidase [Steroidobacter sp.]
MPLRCAAWVGMCLLFAFTGARSDDASCTSKLDSPEVVITTLDSKPAFIRMPAKVSRPPIILWHGFGPPDSEQALMDALPLDDVPAVKVYLGLPMFGARTLAQGELARRQQEDLGKLVFEPVVMGGAKELASVVRALEQRGCKRTGDAIGLFGFSAGGAAVLYALAEADVRVGVAVTLNASTGLTASVNAYERATKKSYVWTDGTRGLALRSDAVGRAKDIAAGEPPPALLIIHGAEDAMLTPSVAVSLHEALLPLYAGKHASQRLQLTVVPGLAHAWANTGNVETLRSSIAAWFQAHL